ncbi:MAG: response regulator [Anaerolineae bacterium]|nr:MAG: response regulator [Anaerolineae bacterium]MCL4875982.1 response regulator [Anaerolineae bacterium]
MAEKILVVDDDVDSLKLIGLMLQRQGYEVVAANAGQPALQKAYHEKPDLIILDVMMPDMDGYEVCRRLRAEPITSEIPIIMFTAKTLVDDKIIGFEAGADDYLTKPTHPAELSARVKTVLSRSQQQRGSVKQEVGTVGGLSIGFLGVKGGVGTTTLAANVGAILAQKDTTILADLRPGQGTLGLSLGFTRAQGLANVLSNRPAGEITSRLIDDNMVTHNSGLKLLLSSTRPQESQLTTTPEAVSAMLRGMSSLAHYRLLDLGSGLNRLTVKLIRELNQTIILVEPNRVTLTIAREVLREIEALGVGAGRTSLVIFNRVQSSLQIPWQEVEQTLNHEVAAIISPAPELAFQAAEAGFPLAHFQPSSIVAGQISKLVEELIKRGG